MPDERADDLVVYRGTVYAVRLPYAFSLDLETAPGRTALTVWLTDPELVSSPTAEQLEAARKRRR